MLKNRSGPIRENNTDQKTAALAEGLTQAFQQIDDLISVWDQNLELVFCNDAFKSINTGLEEILPPGTSLEDYVRERLMRGRYPDFLGQSDIDAIIRNHMLLDPEATGPYDVNLHDDVVIEIKKQCGPGGLTTVIGRNVTAQRLAERQRIESEERFRHLAESASEWFWESDAEGRLTWVSSSFDDRTQIDHSKNLGKPRWKLDGPARNDERFWSDHKATIAAAKPIVNFEFPYHDNAGETGFIRINGSAIRDQNGAATGYRGTAMDITEARKQQQSYLNLPAAMDAMPEAVVVYGPDDRIIFANQAYRTLNVALGDLIDQGASFEELHRALMDRGLVAEAVGREEEWLEERIAQHRTPNGPFELKRADDVWFLTNEMKLNNGGQVILFTDISDLKKIQNELTEARDRAESASLAKTNFLSSMSHEFRTPLNAIIGFSQLMEMADRDPMTEEQADYVGKVRIAGTHLLALVNDVLDLSAIEAGAQNVAIEDVGIHAIVESATGLVTALASNQSVDLRLSSAFEQPLPMVRADPTRLRQVLLNLITNGINYGGGGASIVIDAAPVAGDALKISVRDTGHGIPEDQQKKLFKPFERLGMEGSNIKGAGIGLAISKALIEGMGGEIGFESQVGRGSTFWFRLPVSSDGVVAPGAGIQIIEPEPTQAAESMVKVLYVEDNPLSLDLMAAILKRTPNLFLQSAHTGELGIKMATVYQPDLIFLDINLPGLDGFEVLNRLRENAQTRSIPVVAISAAALPADINLASEFGFVDYLIKPIDAQRILEIVAEFTRV